MHHALILALAALVAGGDEPAELQVCTFNIRYASAEPPNSWVQRRPVLRELLAAESPDLLCTQEGLFDQLKDLAADLPEHGWIGLGREGGSRGEFMAVFYRRSRLELLEFDHFWLSDTPERIGSTSWGNTLPRMVTWARFRDLGSEREFYCFNTHFDHLSQPSRERSAELIARRIEELGTKLPVLLLGDFNSIAEANPVYDTLVGSGRFTDSWTATGERGELVATFHNYRGPIPGGARIDWILTRGGVETLSTRIVTFAKDGQYPSDHFPVTARLRLK